MTAAAAVEPTELEELMEAQTEAAHGGLFDGAFWLTLFLQVPLGLRCGHAGRKGVQHDLLRRGR